MGEPCSQETAILEQRSILLHQEAAIKRIEGHMVDSKKTAEKLVDAIVELTRHHEQIIAVNEKVVKNEDDVRNLFKLFREEEVRLNAHILTPRHSTAGKPDAKDAKFGKVQVSIVTGIIIAVIHSLWDILTNMVVVVQQLIEKAPR